MIKDIKTILFATNLSENCMAAFEFASSLVIRYQASLIMLHVFEKEPEYVHRRLKRFFNDTQWDSLLEHQRKNVNKAREALIAKQSPGKIVQGALQHFCVSAGIDSDSCGYKSTETVVLYGDVVQEIITQADKFSADLIVLGARRGFISDNKVGHTIKSILRKSSVPVLIAPPNTTGSI